MPRSLGVLILVLSLASPLFAAGRALGPVHDGPAAAWAGAVASNGSGFMSAWTLRDSSGRTRTTVYVIPIDRAGSALPGAPIATVEGEIYQVSIVALGREYVVVWSDGQLHLTRVSESGVIGTDRTLPPTISPAASPPAAIASDGRDVLIVGRRGEDVVAARILVDGPSIAAQPLIQENRDGASRAVAYTSYEITHPLPRPPLPPLLTTATLMPADGEPNRVSLQWQPGSDDARGFIVDDRRGGWHRNAFLDRSETRAIIWTSAAHPIVRVIAWNEGGASAPSNVLAAEWERQHAARH